MRYGQRRVFRKLSRSIPWIGGALAVLALGSAIRRKGVVGGSLDTAITAIPFVGGAKSLAELAMGRDIIRDRVRA
ncbi:MAG: hypothetical protein AB7P99_05755 [Vicinamibacterales bacterium]